MFLFSIDHLSTSVFIFCSWVCSSESSLFGRLLIMPRAFQLFFFFTTHKVAKRRKKKINALPSYQGYVLDIRLLPSSCLLLSHLSFIHIPSQHGSNIISISGLHLSRPQDYCPFYFSVLFLVVNLTLMFMLVSPRLTSWHFVLTWLLSLSLTRRTVKRRSLFCFISFCDPKSCFVSPCGAAVRLRQGPGVEVV